MSLFTNEMCDSMNPIKTIIDLKNDHKLITDFVASVQGAGLESLDYPAGRLIDHHLAEKYADHYTLGSGTEGLIKLAVIIGGGVAAYSALVRNKKIKPIVDRTKDLIGKLEKQYPTNFADKHKSVKDDVNPTVLVSKFKGSDFRSIQISIDKWISDSNRDLDALVTKTTTIFKAAEQAVDECKNATDEEKHEISDAFKKKYGDKPYETDFSPEFPGGYNRAITPIAASDYADARKLLFNLVYRFDQVNDILFEDMLFGYHEAGDNQIEAGRYLDHLVTYDAWFNEVGGEIYHYIDKLLEVAKGVEDYIIKSFK